MWRKLDFSWNIYESSLALAQEMLVPFHGGGRRGSCRPCGHQRSATEVALGNIFPRKKTEVFQVILQNWWAKMRQKYVLQRHNLTFFVMLWRNKKPRKNMTLSIAVNVIIPLTTMNLSIWLNSFSRRKKKMQNITDILSSFSYCS